MSRSQKVIFSKRKVKEKDRARAREPRGGARGCRERAVKRVRSFAVYYGMIGSREEEVLKMFDMVIIQDYAVRGGAVLSRLNSTLKIG